MTDHNEIVLNPSWRAKLLACFSRWTNAELLHLLESPEATMNGKVNEALTVLHEFAKDQ
jgi:polyadenylate-binding protein